MEAAFAGSSSGRAARRAVQQCRHVRPRGPIDEIDVAEAGRGARRQYDGHVPDAARLPHSARCGGKSRRAGGSSTTARSRPMCRANSVCYTTTKHAITGLTQDAVAGWAGLRHRLRPDRHRQCRDADGGRSQGRAADTGDDGCDVAMPPASVLHMAKLPPEANVQFMTVMATKMPLSGAAEGAWWVSPVSRHARHLTTLWPPRDWRVRFAEAPYPPAAEGRRCAPWPGDISP
jgi:hypothetical protein